MPILALDLGTNTGWALSSDDNIISGVESFKTDRYSGGGMRYLRFRKWLNEVCDGLGVDRVYFEEVRRHRGTDAAHVYGGLMASLTAYCEEKNIAYEGVPVGTIKRFWTGKGNAPKEAMIAEAKARGHVVADDNEADALAILYWSFEQ
jgi:Holliday junction resolvasome RuvABC endonuclease subunit